MDYQIIWDERAIAELARAVRFIAKHDPVAAKKTGDAILRKAGLLGLFPRIGKVFADLGQEDVREFPVPPYRIFYHIKDAARCVRILKLWHGARAEPKFDSSELNERGMTYGSKRPFTAIAAMSLNRVIGNGNQIPWHLPEDFKWFKAVTSGNVIVMGRKTFESIGKPLPNRETIVLSRSAFSFPSVKTVSSLDELPALTGNKQVFICGGAQIYEQTLPRCSELLLTLVKREVAGDAFFPKFEDQFELVEEICDTPDFKILRYRNRSL
jgi:dihydrofolate reductase